MLYDYYEQIAESLGWHMLNNINSIPLHKEIEFCRSYDDEKVYTKTFASRDEVFNFWCITEFNYWRAAK